MLDSSGFDLWANGYDKSVRLSEEENRYPFAGYEKTLNIIYRIIRSGKGTRVLDVGFGTGVLSKRLYDEGYCISGIDFSAEMIRLAKQKMPDAELLRHDFTQGLPPALSGRIFDFIVCTYAIHHLDDSRKIGFLRELLGHLPAEGKLLIGDVAFETADELEQCRIQSGSAWDAEEYYLVDEALKPIFPRMEFQACSFCSGVFLFSKEGTSGK